MIKNQLDDRSTQLSCNFTGKLREGLRYLDWFYIFFGIIGRQRNIVRMWDEI